MHGQEGAPRTEAEREPRYVRVSAYRVGVCLNESIIDGLIEQADEQSSEALWKVRSSLDTQGIFSGTGRGRIFLLKEGWKSDSDNGDAFQIQKIGAKSVVPDGQIIDRSVGVEFPAVEFLSRLTRVIVDYGGITPEERGKFLEVVNRKLGNASLVFHLKPSTFYSRMGWDRLALELPKESEDEFWPSGRPKVKGHWHEVDLKEESNLRAITLKKNTEDKQV